MRLCEAENNQRLASEESRKQSVRHVPSKVLGKNTIQHIQNRLCIRTTIQQLAASLCLSTTANLQPASKPTFKKLVSVIGGKNVEEWREVK